MILKNFEDSLGKSATDWTETEIKKLFNDEEFLKKIAIFDNLEEFMFELKEKNEYLADTYIAPTYFILSVEIGEKNMGMKIQEYDQKKISLEDLLNESKSLMNGKNPFLRLIGLLTFLNYIESREKIPAKDSIKKDIKETKKYIEGKVDDKYLLIMSWLELIYSIEAIYFEITEEKLFSEEEFNEINDLQTEMNAFTFKLAQDFANFSEREEEKDSNEEESGEQEKGE